MSDFRVTLYIEFYMFVFSFEVVLQV